MAVGTFTSRSARRAFVAAYDEAMAALPTPQRVHDVETSFGTVRAYRFGLGSQTPLLLLPGRSSSTPLWASNLPGLMPIRPVVTLDLLGEPGLSMQTRTIRGAADQERWLSETLDALELPTAHVLGVSFGGWSAVNLAIRRPDRVASLITLDPANTFGRIGLKTVIASLGMAVPAAPDRLRSWSLRWISGGEAAEDSAAGRLIAAGMKGYKVRLPMPRYPTDDELRAITAPALVLIAGRSIMHHPRRAAARARLLPHARVEVWPDASHALSGEFPDRVADRVRVFLTGLG